MDFLIPKTEHMSIRLVNSRLVVSCRHCSNYGLDWVFMEWATGSHSTLHHPHRHSTLQLCKWGLRNFKRTLFFLLIYHLSSSHVSFIEHSFITLYVDWKFQPTCQVNRCFMTVLHCLPKYPQGCCSWIYYPWPDKSKYIFCMRFGAVRNSTEDILKHFSVLKTC